MCKYKILHLPTGTFIYNDLDIDGAISSRFYSEDEVIHWGEIGKGHYNFICEFSDKKVLTKLFKAIENTSEYFLCKHEYIACKPEYFELLEIEDN